MPYITESDKQKLLSSINIVDVIAKTIKLKKAGVNYIGLCPFHTDHTPSLSVSVPKQMFKCFACGKSGNIIDFVMENEKMTYNEACRQIAKDYHILLSDTGTMSDKEIYDQKKKESVLIALDAAQKKYAQNLKLSTSALSYVRNSREFTDEVIALYGMGFADNSNSLIKQATNIQVLKDAGLVKTKEGTSYNYDVFFDRIMFPYYDLRGNVIGFTGRTLDKDCAIKYYNTCDTVVFNKGNNLFGLFQAKQAISECDKAYFMEGQADVISCYQNGVHNVVCGSGTALTENQINQLHRFCKTVVLIYDQDVAGIKAAIRSVKMFLSMGMYVRGIILPQGEDPDSFAKKKKDKLPQSLLNNELDFLKYLYQLLTKDEESNFDLSIKLDKVCECIGVIPDGVVRKKYMIDTAELFHVKLSDVTVRTRLKKDIKIEAWPTGFYGVEDAEILLHDEQADESCFLTFNQKQFIQKIENDMPAIYVSGEPAIHSIQKLRQKIPQLQIENSSIIQPSKNEPEALLFLKELFKEGFDLSILDENLSAVSFCKFYVLEYSKIMTADITEVFRTECVKRCLEVISLENETSRNINLKEYAQCLNIDKSVFAKLLKPILSKKKNKIDFESKRIKIDDLIDIDSQSLPDYVMENEEMHSEYIRSKYYPWIDRENRPVAYVFQNQNGSGHTVLSDFYLQPLLHVRDDFGSNKMVVKLNHIHKQYDKYVEFPSNTFASLQTLNISLVSEGPYNFEGSSLQFKKIWRSVSYGFRSCVELKIFGQQPEGFFAFSNAIFHETDGQYKLEYMDELGVAVHNKQNFYSPAFSKIYIQNRNENDNYKQARNIMYKEIPENKRLSFSQWARLMNEVYCVNDNGKWGILFAITASFRDFIFKHRSFFTALFFIGPTGSGKTQIAESIRNLFVDSKTPSFNLNTGTDAAFFMLLECQKNIIQLMEEYNDRDISQTKFQGLKSATLDGEGKIKVKDIGSKTMDSSVINAALIILGQEASQQDDGGLSNRCILKDVFYPDHEYTEEETYKYQKLKEHERIGLCNILLDILRMRPLVEKHYLQIFDEETKKIKDAVKINLTNTEGLARIINAISLMTATCRFIETFGENLKLPFSYDDFFKIGCDSVLSQIDRISSSNKLTTYFKAISTLLTNNEIIDGREFKIAEVSKVTVKLNGKNKAQKEFDNPIKVLYIDFNEIHTKYKRLIGEREALTEASLRSYFNSNKAYIGLCQSTIFKWQESEWSGTNASFIPDIESDNSNTEIRAQHMMKMRTKNTSAYMFNYEILKELMDIDLERNLETQSNKNSDSPDLPF